MWYIILKVGCALCLFEAFSVCGTVCLEWFSYAEVTDTSVERVFNCTGLWPSCTGHSVYHCPSFLSSTGLTLKERLSAPPT